VVSAASFGFGALTGFLFRDFPVFRMLRAARKCGWTEGNVSLSQLSAANVIKVNKDTPHDDH
jgi:hypothetical protein